MNTVTVLLLLAIPVLTMLICVVDTQKWVEIIRRVGPK